MCRAGDRPAGLLPFINKVTGAVSRQHGELHQLLHHVDKGRRCLHAPGFVEFLVRFCHRRLITIIRAYGFETFFKHERIAENCGRSPRNASKRSEALGGHSSVAGLAKINVVFGSSGRLGR
jgi:hypothetical protein